MYSVHTALRPPKRRGERNTKESKTVPDQALTIKQIFEQYAKDPNGKLTAEYYGEDFEIPNLKAMDITERLEYEREIAHKIEANKDGLRKQAEKKRLEKEKVEKEKTTTQEGGLPKETIENT